MPRFTGTDLPSLKDSADSLATRKSILDLLDKINTVADSSYPVGATYTQYAGQTAPAALFGGTWTDITATSLPTSVYDSGSNANGSWIRWTDGTMQCWGTTAQSAAINTPNDGYFIGPVFNLTLPIAYVDGAYSVDAYATNATGHLSQTFVTGNPVSTGFSVYPAAWGAAGATAKVTWKTIGKWSSAPVYPVTLWKRTGGSLTSTAGTSVVNFPSFPTNVNMYGTAMALPSATFTKIANTVITDSNNEYSTSTNRFTPKEAGVYLFTTAANVGAGGFEVDMFVTGARYRAYVGGGTANFGNGAMTVQLGLGDYVELYVFTGGGATTYGGGPLWGYTNIVRVK